MPVLLVYLLLGGDAGGVRLRHHPRRLGLTRYIYICKYILIHIYIYTHIPVLLVYFPLGGDAGGVRLRHHPRRVHPIYIYI